MHCVRIKTKQQTRLGFYKYRNGREGSEKRGKEEGKAGEREEKLGNKRSTASLTA